MVMMAHRLLFCRLLATSAFVYKGQNEMYKLAIKSNISYCIE